MERRVFLAAAISVVFLSLYARFVVPPARLVPSDGRPTGEAAAPGALPGPSAMAIAASLEPLRPEEVVTISSANLELEIGQHSGAIRRATLKQFLQTEGGGPLRFGGELPLVRLLINGKPLTCSLRERAAGSVTLDAADAGSKHYYLTITIRQSKPILDIVLQRVSVNSTSSIDGLEVVGTWSQGDAIGGRYNRLEIIGLAKDSALKSAKYLRYYGPLRNEKSVPRGTTLLSLSERYFCESINPGPGAEGIRLIPSAPETIAASISLKMVDGTDGHAIAVYFGPRDYFRLREAGFERAFPIGMLGQIGLILLVVLNALSRFTHSEGVGIVLFSGLVSCLMAPFTLLSLKSMKKMQELKPQVDRIMAHQKDDPQRANREMLELYKTHRVNPMSGCLPMMLQLPIFIALFQAISHDIQLRGKTFLWIRDLSLPDRLAHLPVSLPLFGSDLNLLPIVTAVAMFFQTKFSQQRMPTDQSNPMAKAMSGPLMSVMFGFMFYQVPSGLVLYWLTNSLISMAWYRLAK